MNNNLITAQETITLDDKKRIIFKLSPGINDDQIVCTIRNNMIKEAAFRSGNYVLCVIDNGDKLLLCDVIADNNILVTKQGMIGMNGLTIPNNPNIFKLVVVDNKLTHAAIKTTTGKMMGCMLSDHKLTAALFDHDVMLKELQVYMY